MSVIADDDIIDQTDYDEFTGVANREIFEEEEVEETVVIMDHPEISPHWQVSSEHTFTKEHFCKVTSCAYTLIEACNLAFSYYSKILRFSVLVLL